MAKIIGTSDRSENIDPSCLKTLILFHNVHETYRCMYNLSDEVRLTTVTTLNSNIWYVRL